MNEQHFAIECDRHDESETHDDCTVIVSVATADFLDDNGAVIHPKGSVLWASHAHSTIDPAVRISPEHPIEDRRRGAKAKTIKHRAPKDGEPVFTV